MRTIQAARQSPPAPQRPAVGTQVQAPPQRRSAVAPADSSSFRDGENRRRRRQRSRSRSRSRPRRRTAIYIVRVGNSGLASTITPSSPNHWHYLSPQLLWGLPRTSKHYKVRDQFNADLTDPQGTRTYLFFLCNGHGNSKGHFVQVGVGKQHVSGRGPLREGEGAPLAIPEDMMERLKEGFENWFDWWPLSTEAGFEERVKGLPVPSPHFIQTLREVREEHPSFETFRGFVREVEAEEGGRKEREREVLLQKQQDQEQQQEPQVSAGVVQSQKPPIARRVPKAEIQEEDLQNIRRESVDPHSPGSVYLIHMSETSFYKIGMSLSPEVRLQTLQTGNPHVLVLVATRSVEDMRDAELSLHQWFNSRRVPNQSVKEWFDLGEDRNQAVSAFASVSLRRAEGGETMEGVA